MAHASINKGFKSRKSSYNLDTGINNIIRGSRSPSKTSFIYTERHLKCIWFDSSLRPANLQTHKGESVIIDDPGRWNLEAGPDFLGAVLRIGSEQRRISGNVEIHITPSDWQKHGHSNNPAYKNVIAHVTYFTGNLPSGILPKNTVQISLKAAVMANPFFAFEAIDITAYPFVSHKQPTACADILSKCDSYQFIALLEAAGKERILRKAERMAIAIEEKGIEQVLYEEVMSALSYKQNRKTFRYLAELVPVEVLREESKLNTTAAYSLLLGVAGLLPHQMNSRWNRQSSIFVRELWNYWWKYQAQWKTRILNKKAWVQSSLRPQNQPKRRLYSAAILFCQKKTLAKQVLGIAGEDAQIFIKKALPLLQPTYSASSYWNFHLSFSGKAQKNPIALIGKMRAATIISNVFIPFLAALGYNKLTSVEFLRKLTGEEDNSIIRQVTYSLLGPDHNPALYQTALRQQGLIQIFHDFCINDRSGCKSCPLPTMLKRWLG